MTTAWACPSDGTPLQEAASGPLVCEGCGRSYSRVERCATFGAGREAATPAGVGELLELVQQTDPESAARTYCLRHGCVRGACMADRPFFLPGGSVDRAVELGAGFGDTTVALGQRAAEVVSLVPSLAHGRLLLARHEHDGPCGFQVGVPESLTRLPLVSASAGVVCIDEAWLGAFGVQRSSLRASIEEWRRVLAPGGSLVLALGNGVFSRLLGGSRAPRLDRHLAGAGLGGRPRWSVRAWLGLMASRGFLLRGLFAPLPHDEDLRIVLPVRDPRAVAYCLQSVARRNSLAVRWALRGGLAAARLGLLERMLPSYFAVFDGPGEPS